MADSLHFVVNIVEELDHAFGLIEIDLQALSLIVVEAHLVFAHFDLVEQHL